MLPKKLFTSKSYMYKEDLSLNNPQPSDDLIGSSICLNYLFISLEEAHGRELFF